MMSLHSALPALLIRVGLESPPEALRVGSTVNGLVEFARTSVIAVPASALTIEGDLPAVWIVGPTGRTVTLRPAKMLRYEPHRIVLAGGLDSGETIVATGIQALYPGQRVDPLRSDTALPGRPPSAERRSPRLRGRAGSKNPFRRRPRRRTNTGAQLPGFDSRSRSDGLSYLQVRNGRPHERREKRHA